MSDIVNRKTVRKALRSWDRSTELGQDPLASLVIVEARRTVARYQPSGTGYGLALRDVLRAAIHQTMPKGEKEEYYAKRWRAYLILTQQYLEGRSPDYLAEQMGVARSTYDHAQAEALDRLVEILGEWEDRGVLPDRAFLPDLESVDEPRAAFNVPPLPPQGLVGREGLVKELRQALVGDHANVALSGLPGVGKTALAIALAHDGMVREHFVDGVLWAGLGQSANILSQLSIWAIALGLPLEGISQFENVSDRAKAIHAAIGDGNMLLVIDDVWDAAAGLALQVGGPNCAHVFTSRMARIAVELAGDGAREVHELDEGEGENLLRSFLPKIDSDSARSLVKRVDGLPLGLVIMGKYLQGELRTGHPRRMKEAFDRLEYSGELLGVAHPQSALDQQPSLPPDLPLSLGTVIDLSLQNLEESSKGSLVSLSLFPPKPNTFSEEAAIEVSGGNVELLDSLTDHGLLELAGEGHYTLHRTVSELARMSLEAGDVHERYVNYFLQFIEFHRDDHLALEAESRNILAGFEIAQEMGSNETIIQGVNAYFPHLEVMGYLEQAGFYLAYAEQAARELDDRSGLIATLANLGKLSQRRAEYGQSEVHYGEGLALAQELGDVVGECTMLQGLGAVAFSLGDYESAQEHYVRGLTLVDESEYPQSALGLNANMGTLVVTLGDMAMGEIYFQKALELARDVGDRVNSCSMLMNLGILAARQRKYGKAQDHFRESLAIARQAGMQKNIAYMLLNLGTLASDQGEDRKAYDYFHDALKMAQKMGDRAQISQLHGNLGALATKGGNYDEAESHLQEGLTLAGDIGHREHTIHLLINLGALYVEKGALDDAKPTFEKALRLAEKINHKRYTSITQKQLDDLSRRV